MKGWVKQDENFVVENTRNEAGLIIKADGTMVSGSRELIVYWEIDYEERALR